MLGAQEQIVEVGGIALIIIAVILLPHYLPIHHPTVGQMVLRDLLRVLWFPFVPLLASKTLLPGSGLNPMNMGSYGRAAFSGICCDGHFGDAAWQLIDSQRIV